MVDPGEALIRRYYDCFNGRRFTEAAALISPECEFDHRSTREHAHGRRGFVVLAEQWCRAAPDLELIPEHIAPIAHDRYRVALRIRGHRDGAFDLGVLTHLEGDGAPFDLVATHEVRLRDGQIIESHFSYNREDFVRDE